MNWIRDHPKSTSTHFFNSWTEKVNLSNNQKVYNFAAPISANQRVLILLIEKKNQKKITILLKILSQISQIRFLNPGEQVVVGRHNLHPPGWNRVF